MGSSLHSPTPQPPPLSSDLPPHHSVPLGNTSPRFTPYAISAISGFGIADLLDTICSHFPQEERSPPLVQDGDQVHGSGEEGIGVAIIGRPNVGKSSLLNALLGEERAIVSPLSGTTRDAIDSRHLDSEGQLYRIIDTAGIRRRGAVLAGGSRTEGLSVQRALRAVGRADVAVVVLDALVGPTEQDYRLGERVQEMGKGCVIVVNKWDAVPEKDTMTAVQYEQNLRDHLKSLDWAPVVFASASSKQRVPRWGPPPPPSLTPFLTPSVDPPGFWRR